jgi:hypothetical protein
MIDFTKLNNTFFYVTDKQYAIDIVNVVVTVATSFLLSCIFVSKYVKDYDEEEEEEEEEKIIPYESKYPLPPPPYNLNNNFIPDKQNFICENTPNGTVFMRYGKDDEGFDYWCNDNQIEYKYLETVARKFVNIFNCQHLYFDREKDIKRQKLELELKNITDNLTSKNEKIEVENNNNDDDVFIKAKPIKKDIKNKNKNNDIIPTNSNKFIKKGKIKELTEHLLFPTGKIIKENKKFSFADYKRLFG